MTLEAAIRKAEMTGVFQVYQISNPQHKLDIRFGFDEEGNFATDWQVFYPETFKGYSGIG